MTKEDLKRRDLIAKAFTSKWRYKTDKEQFGAADSWRIIYYAERSWRDTGGEFVGD